MKDAYELAEGLYPPFFTNSKPYRTFADSTYIYYLFKPSTVLSTDRSITIDMVIVGAAGATGTSTPVCDGYGNRGGGGGGGGGAVTVQSNVSLSSGKVIRITGGLAGNSFGDAGQATTVEISGIGTYTANGGGGGGAGICSPTCGGVGGSSGSYSGLYPEAAGCTHARAGAGGAGAGGQATSACITCQTASETGDKWNGGPAYMAFGIIPVGAGCAGKDGYRSNPSWSSECLCPEGTSPNGYLGTCNGHTGISDTRNGGVVIRVRISDIE